VVVVVESVPAVFDAALDPELLRDVLSALVGDATAGDEPVTDVVDELLADLACYPSVTGNTSLTEGSVVDPARPARRLREPLRLPARSASRDPAQPRGDRLPVRA